MSVARLERYMLPPGPTRSRSKTIAPAALLRQLRTIEIVEYPHDVRRPSMRSHCEVCETCQAWRDGGEDPPEVLGCGHSADEAIAHTRPCVFVGCTRNNYLDENRDTGAVKFNRPHVEPGDVARDSCSEDVEDEGGATLERVGAAIGVTRERVRQNETIGLRKLKNADGISPPDDRETYAGSPGPRPGCP